MTAREKKTKRKSRKTAEVTVLPAPPRERAGTGLRSLELRNVRCFVSVDVPLDAKVTVIIGQNGSGKTTIAEVLASLAHGDDEGLEEFPLRRDATDGSIALIGDGAEPLASWAKPSRGRARSRLSADRLLFAYGRYRRVHSPEAPIRNLGGMPLLGPEWEKSLAKPRPDSLESATRRPRTQSVMRPDSALLRDIGDYLPLLYARRASDPAIERAWQRFDTSLAELDERIERIEVIERDSSVVTVLIRRGIPLELKELSDGYQAMLAIIVDLLIWYVHLFADLPDPLCGEATVVIDEVDLHLHPRWQRAVIGQLTHLFPATQFILTTHSAAVVQGAIDQRYPVLVLEDEKHGE
ncbi:MAG: AAA family ATPase, partial [Byssovorax sp.]